MASVCFYGCSRVACVGADVACQSTSRVTAAAYISVSLVLPGKGMLLGLLFCYAFVSTKCIKCVITVGRLSRCSNGRVCNKSLSHEILQIRKHIFMCHKSLSLVRVTSRRNPVYLASNFKITYSVHFESVFSFNVPTKCTDSMIDNIVTLLGHVSAWQCHIQVVHTKFKIILWNSWPWIFSQYRCVRIENVNFLMYCKHIRHIIRH